MKFKVLAIVWMLALVVVFGAFFEYHATAGEATVVPSSLPINVVDANGEESQDFNLLFFVHPGCPCTKSSWYELERVVIPMKEHVRTTAIMLEYETGVSEEDRTNLEETMQATGVVDIQYMDVNRAKELFNVTTSGHCMLYDRTGKLLFEGGVTPGRAHTGPNKGIEDIIKIIGIEAVTISDTATQPTSHADVYGCGL